MNIAPYKSIYDTTKNLGLTNIIRQQNKIFNGDDSSVVEEAQHQTNVQQQQINIQAQKEYDKQNQEVQNIKELNILA